MFLTLTKLSYLIVFVERLVPKTKLITIEIICKPPDQLRFLEILSDSP